MSGFFYVLSEEARLLFVDDDPILREFAQVNLSSALAEVDVAADGIEALEALSRRPYDVLLVDLHMPRMDGFALLAAIRNNPETIHLPVIVETGREDVEAIDRAYQAGATAFVTKPLNWRLLSYQIRYTLRSARAEAALRAGLEASRAD
ncbi:response regulator [Brevundimonas sp. AJA228-03]|uniref:response regulator n=1 Tax=Brevundimonas sp. AJA228-03 TaxID=2752515 RepID=UPI001AE00807|nr:response regulator [Brevundimonas sp. AJA228-03]QTN18327.1 response regulator [Brevundimonas sp. AJA228-03]